MKPVNLEIDGKKIRVWAQKLDGKYWVHVGGCTMEFSEGSKSATKRKRGAEVGDGHVRAPMPGKITRVAVKPGDPIETGKVVLIMEAMKMEYTLKAAVAGTVKSVPTRVGEQVVMGKLLVEIDSGKKG